MSNIEDDIKKLNKFNEYENAVVLSEEALYEIQEAIEHILSEREQDKARIKELEEELYSANKIVEEYTDSIPKQKVKDVLDDIYDYFERLNGPDEDIEYIESKRKELLEEGE